jgi:hypothetical protein
MASAPWLLPDPAVPVNARGPASFVQFACPGRSTARSGALRTRDRYDLWQLFSFGRSRISGAPLGKSSALHRIQDTRCGHEVQHGAAPGVFETARGAL